MGNFINQVKTIILTMVIKRNKAAQLFETSLEMTKAADKYINTIDYGDLWDSYIKFDYIDKEKHLLEAVEYRTYNDCNLVIPDSIVYNDTTYHVLSATTNGHSSTIQCHTVYLPASLVYFNHEQLLDRNKVRRIVVAPDNRYYRSVDGDLFLGDSLLFDTHFSYQDQLTDEEY